MGIHQGWSWVMGKLCWMGRTFAFGVYGPRFRWKMDEIGVWVQGMEAGKGAFAEPAWKV